MATTVFLIRHAAHGLVDDVLCGRMPGVHLGEAGRLQAEMLAGHLGRKGLAALYSSPLPRALETAALIADRMRLDVRIHRCLDEIDFGEWTGHSFASLANLPDWTRWNSERASSRPPGGETMQEAQQRALHYVQEITDVHPDAAVAAVSHADVIKAVVAGVLGLSLDAHARFEIAPASLTTLLVWSGGAKLLRMNEAVVA
ncbi:MAG: histidine phosphatase family protein [Acetobacteraceae bacterium]|nr:histidine phosphatase family protein [Acetobacteraceae bacterium]